MGAYAKVRYFIHFMCKILSFTNVILNFCRKGEGATKYLPLDQKVLKLKQLF
jgi:hypothetical protein